MKIALALIVTLGLGSVAHAETTIKIASLAPEGSTWWKSLVELDQKVKEKTQGRVRLKLYSGGVAGDEPDVVRKMRVGSLQGGALTSVGLSELQPALMTLQAPGLFASWEELNAVRSKMSGRLAGLLDEKGVEVLLWGDVGFNRPFSNVPVKVPSDLKNTKSWVWTQDGTYRLLYELAGAKPVPLGVPEVLPSLQTGLIDAFCSAPLAVVSLQWFSRVEYMLDHPVSVTIGALVVTKKTLEKLSPEDKATLLALSKEAGESMGKQVRADNESSVVAIKKAGVQVITPDAATRAQWDAFAVKVADTAAANKVFPAELLNEARAAVQEVRKAGK